MVVCCFGVIRVVFFLYPHLFFFFQGHYKFALSTVFDRLGFGKAIILEDDMAISPDFFEYFRHFQVSFLFLIT